MIGFLFSTSAYAAAISQGFRSETNLDPGTLVSVKANSSDQVVPADSDNVDGLAGIVVGSNGATISLTSKGDRLQVATGGTASLLVTDLAGKVKDGDPITASPIKGVGMLATEGDKIVGIAQANLKSNGGSKKVTVKTKTGKSQTASIELVPVTVQIGYFSSPAKKSLVPAFLQQVANSAAGKEVSVGKVLVAAAIVFGAIALVIIILFSAVRSAIISIGRNPLAQSDIYKGLLQVLLTAVVIMGIAVGSSYLILSR